jgi:hypothetical protein
MSERIELEGLDLAALLCSRVCHDIISPVGAITNGLEVLDEDDNEEMKAFAFDLIRKSAAQASAKLQFARLAFGAAGSAGAEIDLADAEKVARGYMQAEKAELSWEAPRALMAKNRVKLLLNLLRGAALHLSLRRPVGAGAAGLREAGARRHRRDHGRRPCGAALLRRPPRPRLPDAGRRRACRGRGDDRGAAGGVNAGRAAFRQY